MISVEQHLDRILSTVKLIAPFDLGVLDAQGCILAADVRARGSLPGFTNSAMDGYAVHSADISMAGPGSPVVLPVVNDIAAGNTKAWSLATGQTMRIMTGAPMPHGADAVVDRGQRLRPVGGHQLLVHQSGKRAHGATLDGSGETAVTRGYGR